MVDNLKVERDEARRSAQHADVKSVLANEVQRAIASEGRAELAHNTPEVAAVGRELEHRAVREVVETDREVARTRTTARGAQVIDYIFFVIYGLIVIEIVLEAAGARESNGFKNAMDAITTPFLAPFRGLFSDPAIGEYRIMFSYIAGLVVWILIHLAIRGLLRVIGTRSTRI